MSNSNERQPLLSTESEQPFHYDNESLYDDKRDNSDLVSQSVEVKSTPARFYILVIFCFVGFTNFVVWNTFGPIQSSAKYVYGWDNGMIALLADWGLVTLVAFPPFFVVVLKKKGLRVAELITVACMVLGCGIRLINTDNNSINTAIINVGQFLNGIGGVVPMAAAPMLSVTWFPDNERRTATAFAAGTQQMGLALSFLIGPLLVEEPKINGSDVTTDDNVVQYEILSIVMEEGETEKDKIANQIMLYIYLQFGAVALLTLCVVVYYPRAPKAPPSAVSMSAREDLLPSVREIILKPKFWSLACTYGFFSGFFNSYLSVLSVDLSPIGFSQFLAGWLGFATTIIGATTGMFICNLTDKFREHNPIKKVLIFLLCLAFLLFFGFVFVAKFSICDGLSENLRIGIIFALVMLTGACSASTIPLIFEMGSDILYPISEEVIGSMLVLVQNTFGLVILLVFLIPNIGTSWLDYTVLAGIAAALPMILFTDDQNVRQSTRLSRVTNGDYS